MEHAIEKRKSPDQRTDSHTNCHSGIFIEEVDLGLITAFVYYTIYVINVSLSKMRVAVCSRYFNNTV